MIDVATRWVRDNRWQGFGDMPMVPVSLPKISCLEPPVPRPVVVTRREPRADGRTRLTVLGEYATPALAKRAMGDVRAWVDMRGDFWRSTDGLTTIEPVAP